MKDKEYALEQISKQFPSLLTPSFVAEHLLPVTRALYNNNGPVFVFVSSETPSINHFLRSAMRVPRLLVSEPVPGCLRACFAVFIAPPSAQNLFTSPLVLC